MPKTKKTKTRAKAKAQAQTRVETDITTPRRQSTRQRVPPTKSPYFEHPSENEEEEEDTSSETGSNFDDEHANKDIESDTGPEAAEDEETGESDAKPSKKSRTSSNAAAVAQSVRKKQKRQGEETFIPYKEPSPSGIDYADDQIHPNTLKFLEDLAENNDRNWLREHDSIYRAGKSDFEKFVEHMNEAIPEHVDDTIPVLPVKDLVFRIHRDIRFSNDQTPYKTHFSAAWSRTGRKGPYACYYLQIKPGQSVAGGGLWHPESHALNLIRQSIDKHPNSLKSVLTGNGFAAEFFSYPQRKDERSIVQSFAKKNGEDALKTAPKITYLNSCVMPDLNGDEDSDED
ncbi:hypothetical protein BDD12DRAFT_51441 [Trichophaea hybrida]|nr:hypothetical protein BDD12DRAFT_51441 [Trichophaea hybrida]